jgi:hypothetical protein
MKRKILFFAFALALLWTSQLSAQKVATSSLQFLKVMPTARATAMGDAFSTLASGADAVFWNPAGVTLAQHPEFSGTLSLWMFDSRQGALSFATSMGEWGSIGVQVQYVDYGAIQETSVDQLRFIGDPSAGNYNPGLTGRTFSPSSYVIGLSYARQLTDKFSAGVTAKFVNESLWEGSTTTVVNPSTGLSESVNTFARLFLFDFGMQYNTGFRSVCLGVSIQNFGQQVKFGTEAYPAPLAFRIGAAADVIGKDALLGESAMNRLTVAYDLFQPNDYAQQMHLGTEYALDETVFLRAGYKFNYDSDGFTAGIGVRHSFIGTRFGFDYSYGTMGEFLPSVHRISVGAQLQ